MNKLFKKAASLLTAAVMTVTCLGTECFAEASKAAEPQVTSTTVEYGAIVAKPTYKIKGTKGIRRISLSTATKGAEIHFTTDGTVPTAKSKVFPAGAVLKITKDTKIRAIAILGSSKSSIMTKTIKVSTLYGDVTGDGNINNTDYVRLKNYFDGTTKFICKDNADCDGSGGLNKVKDLSVLAQYLNHKIDSLPSKYVAALTMPAISQEKVYGGIQITISGSESGSVYYYTLNGGTPTNTSTKYTMPFIISKNCTLKAVSYKSDSYSPVNSNTITVPTASDVSSSKDPSVKYEQSISVALTCTETDAVIYYTTDASDPKTSNTVQKYESPLTLDADTTIKAYARAKGYLDGEVRTYTYKVDAAFRISGTVWDDTPGTTTSSEGKQTSGESGISGINVYLLNAATPITSVTSTAYIKKTTTDSKGDYSFDNLANGVAYKVMFEYNSQKYRGYGSLVEGGNQAIPLETPDMLVNFTGAYTVGANYLYDKNLTSINNYKTAVSDDFFTNYAVTTRSYTAATSNVDFALISKNYGILELSMKVEGQTSDNMAKKGTRLTYTITLTNNSPMPINTLKSVSVVAYMPKCCTSFDVQTSGSSRAVEDLGNLANGYRGLVISDITGANGLSTGKSLTIVINTCPDRVENGDVLTAFAEVDSYRFATSCYDYYSTPGNLVMGAVKERDEAAAAAITIGNSTASDTTNKSISVTTSSTVNLVRGETQTDAFIVVVKNATSLDDAIIGAMNGNTINYTVEKSLSDGILFLFFTITADAYESGKTTIPIYLSDNTKKKVTLTAIVF